MVKNVSKLIMLLVPLAILMHACSALQPVNSGNSTSRKTPSSVSKEKKGVRGNIIRTARKYKGAKYKYGGRNPKGFDCSGFTSYVLGKHDIEISGSSRTQSRLGKRISPNKAKAGDLAFFGRGGKVTHVALITDNNRGSLEVIHSTSSKGVIEQNVTNSSYWKPRLLFIRNVID